jgi:hypothetical protein
VTNIWVGSRAQRPGTDCTVPNSGKYEVRSPIISWKLFCVISLVGAFKRIRVFSVITTVSLDCTRFRVNRTTETSPDYRYFTLFLSRIIRSYLIYIANFCSLTQRRRRSSLRTTLLEEISVIETDLMIQVPNS